MKNLDVVAIGNANIDLVFKIPRLLTNDDKVVGKKVLESVGGTVANTACVMGRLGLNVASLSAVGTDLYGARILEDFKRHQVNTDYIDIVADLEANMAIIMLDDSGEKALIYAPGKEPAVSKTRYQQAISQCKAVYTMPGDIDEFVKFATIAHQHHAQVVVDIEPHIADSREKLDRILTHTDVAFFNHDGFIASTTRQPTASSLTELLEQYNLHTIVVTLGARGAVAVNKLGYSEHSGYSVPVIDTTGAGDTFNGSFIYSLINHYPLDKALEFACACSAISVGYLGARADIPSVEQVQDFIQHHQTTLN